MTVSMEMYMTMSEVSANTLIQDRNFDYYI